MSEGTSICHHGSQSLHISETYSHRKINFLLISVLRKEYRDLFDRTQYSLKLNDYTLETVNSKKQLLSEISKIFDPVSFFYSGHHTRARFDEEDVGNGNELGR